MAGASEHEPLRRHRHRWRAQRPGRRRVPGEGRAADRGPRTAPDGRRRGGDLRAGTGRPRADAGPHRRAAAAVGRPRPRAQAPRAVARRSGGARLRAGHRRRRDRRCGAMSPGPPRACGPGRSPTPTRMPRSTGWCARCRASSARSPDGRRPTSNRPVSATPSPGSSSGGRSVASGATTAGRSPASCRWRSPTSWPNRSRPTRSRPRSPGAASSTPRWGRGRRARPRSCWPIRPATTGAPPARRSSRAAGPGALATALEAAAREAGVEIRTDAEVTDITSRDGRATGVVAGRWRGAHGAGRRRRHRSRSAPSPGWRIPWPSARACSGAPTTSGRRGRSPRSTSCSPGCRSSRPPPATRGCSAAGSSSPRASMPWSGPTTRPSTAATRTHR